MSGREKENSMANELNTNMNEEPKTIEEKIELTLSLNETELKKEKPMRFIKLTGETDETVYIDADTIETIAGFLWKDNLCCSRINTISNCTYWVQESPEAIVALIEQKGE